MAALVGGVLVDADHWVGSSATCSGRVLADPMLTFLMVHQLGRVAAVARCGKQALASVDEMGEQGPTPRARVRVDAAGECLDAGCRSRNSRGQASECVRSIAPCGR